MSPELIMQIREVEEKLRNSPSGEALAVIPDLTESAARRVRERFQKRGYVVTSDGLPALETNSKRVRYTLYVKNGA